MAKRGQYEGRGGERVVLTGDTWFCDKAASRKERRCTEVFNGSLKAHPRTEEYKETQGSNKDKTTGQFRGYTSTRKRGSERTQGLAGHH